MPTRKKLIEVALPLEAINQASAREKSIRHGHPSTLHLWWARRPLAAARAVIFASLVDDPDSPDALPAFVEACRRLPKLRNADLHDTPRMRLFDFIEQLVLWESTTDERILNTARDLIQIATEGSPPPLLDPFAGGGSIPLEAQRLGLEAHASDLNPVAVMINKAQIEIPPRFANRPPVNPRDRAQLFDESGGGTKRRGVIYYAPTTWRGAAGLAADVRYYGEWMRERAWERIGHLYPTHHGETVIAWIWARTVKSPNPAVNVHVPLVRSFILSKKKGKEAWAQPVIEVNDGGGMMRPGGTDDDGRGMMHHAPTDAPTHRIRFEITPGVPPKDKEGTVNRTGGRCIVSGTPMPFEYIRAEGKAGRMGAQLMAIVTEGKNGRNYHSPSDAHVQVAKAAKGGWRPAHDISHWPGRTNVVEYGLTQFADLFTPRQLVALTTFSDLVAEARAQVEQDARAAGLPDDGIPLREGGRGVLAYAEAVSVYLAFGVDRQVERTSTLATWQSSADKVRGTFGRQALPMIWDYAEVNPFSDSTGNFRDNCVWVAEATESNNFSINNYINGNSSDQVDAAHHMIDGDRIISTDPPYYDNIGYADLSDFFYVWLRRAVHEVYPDIFGTMLVPKTPELIASPYRHGGSKAAANQHFEGGMRQAFSNLRRFAAPDYPLTVYYAFKQQDAEDDGEAGDTANDGPAGDDDDRRGVIYYAPTGDATHNVPAGGGATGSAPASASTGWETMLSGLIQAGFSIGGTWPMRTERAVRTISIGTNALASSIVLVCRPRPDDAPTINRGRFLDLLRRELPAALRALQSGNIAPVDLAQASIGPGMAIYSRYTAVLEADGSPMRVRTALGLINHALDEYLAEQEGDIDGDSRFAVAWFEQFGFGEGEFGVADVLARAKNTSVAGVEESGVVQSGKGKVKLVHWKNYDPGGYNPGKDRRTTIWEAAHHLIERLHSHGEEGAALLRNRLKPEVTGEARNLAYRLYSICERKGWAEHARDYNALVIEWPAIAERAAEIRRDQERNVANQQERLFE